MKFSNGVKISLVCLAMVACFVGGAMASEVTLIGEINDNYQFVVDTEIYEIADTEKGNDLAENYISSRVKVTGAIEEEGDMKIIMVTSFQVVSD